MSAARRREVLERFDIPLGGSVSSCKHSITIRRTGAHWIIATIKSSLPKRRRRTVGETKKETEDEFLVSLEERYKDVTPDPPAKRLRPGFIPELSSDSDSDPVATITPARFTKRRKVVALSDDFDPANEPLESEDGKDFELGASEDGSINEASEPPSPEKPVKGKGKSGPSMAGNIRKRDALLKSYDVGRDIPKVLLVSLKAGALGVQLTAANNIFLMVCWSRILGKDASRSNMLSDS
jgi:hypothetical protein